MSLSKVLKKIGQLILSVSKKIDEEYNYSSKEVEIRNNFRSWARHQGDKTLRLNYELFDKSVVFDLGGYEGQWASDIYSKYLSNIYVFEPYLPYFQKIEERFKANSDIKVYPFGLGNGNFDALIYPAGDGTTMFGIDKRGVKMRIVAIDEFMSQYNIEEIDLMKINIEGGEYDLLDYILEVDLIKKIKNIQVQFHNKYIENPEMRMRAIQERLLKSHELSWQYEFVWENWTRKNNPGKHII